MFHILYVDDEPDLLELGKAFLESQGEFSVDTVLSAEGAFPLLGSNDYSAIVSDYQMPEMDGIQFLRAVRERFDDIPFILFTGRGREEVVIDAINNGADFYLQKGGDVCAQFAELSHKIRQTIRRREAERELRRSEFRLRSFMETTHESVAIVDEEGRVIEWNAATERITGIEKEEALGTRLWDITFRMLPREQRTEERRALIEERIRTSLKTGIPVFKEPQVIESEGPDGSRIYTRQTLFLIKTDKGFGIGSISQDITKERLAETAIRESEKKYHDLAELLPQMVFEVDTEFRVLWANQHTLDVLGITPQEIEEGITAGSFIAPTDLESVNEDVSDFFSDMQPGAREYTAARKDTSTFPVLVHSAPVYNNEKLSGFFVVAVDITERKMMEYGLRASEEKFRGMAERSSDLILVLNNEMSPVFVSPSVQAMLGFAPEELVGKTPEFAMATIFSETGPALMNAVRNTMSGLPVENVELQLTRKDKTPALVSMSAVPVLREGIVEGVQVSMRDITEQKATQLALQAVIGSMVGTTGLDSLQQIAKTVSSWLGADCVMIGEIQPDHNTVKVLSMILDGNQVHDFVYHLKGTPCENVAEKRFCHYPDDSVRLFPHAKDFIELNIRGYAGTPLLDSHGMVVGILCVLSRKPLPLPPSAKNILDTIATKAGAEIERSRMERALQESELKFRTLVETSPNIIFEVDGEGEFMYISPPVKDILGYAPEEITSRSIMDLAPTADDETAYRNVLDKFLKSAGSLLPTELAVRHRDGRLVILEICQAKVFQADGRLRGFRGVAIDVTDRKKAELALQQANKKLNLLSGITRHDILNTITGLLGCVDMAKATRLDDERLALLDEIKDLVRVIQRQIVFTREYQEVGVRQPVWQNVNEVITLTCENFRSFNLSIVIDLQNMEIYADPLLEKVFYNLVDNAIRYGDTLTMISFSFQISDKGLSIICQDDGAGIEPKAKERIFERGVGRNTGMGLFLTREILAITGITIQENGEEGKGARFEITVPAGSWRVAGR